MLASWMMSADTLASRQCGFSMDTVPSSMTNVAKFEWWRNACPPTGQHARQLLQVALHDLVLDVHERIQTDRQVDAAVLYVGKRAGTVIRRPAPANSSAEGLDRGGGWMVPGKSSRPSRVACFGASRPSKTPMLIGRI